jgi:hypothetical protein
MTDPTALEETTKIKIRALNNTSPIWLQEQDGNLRILTINIRSLRKHLPDLTSHPLLMASDLLCITETHLIPGNNVNNEINIADFSHVTASYGPGKGVCIYWREEKFTPKVIICQSLPNFQIITISLAHCFVTCIYRSTSPVTSLFDIYNILEQHNTLTAPHFITGDFNTKPKNAFSILIANMGFAQKITFPTHQAGNTLDHVYFNRDFSFQYFIQPVHFSDHDAVLSILSN